MEIKIFTEAMQDKKFYGVMGPLFANKEFYKIFQEPLYNESCSTWFIMMEKSTVIGFCAAFKKKTHLYFNQLFVTESNRCQGYGKQLFDARMEYFKEEREIRSMVKNEKSLKLHIANGFEQYGKKGHYKLMRRVK